jgi:hypothetical protein
MTFNNSIPYRLSIQIVLFIFLLMGCTEKKEDKNKILIPIVLAASSSGGDAVNLRTTYSIGGTVTGLVGTLILQNDYNNLTITKNGVFTFEEKLKNYEPYSIAVVNQPSGQVCLVYKGAGYIHSTNITDIKVECIVLIPSVFPIIDLGNTLCYDDSVMIACTGDIGLFPRQDGDYINKPERSYAVPTRDNTNTDNYITKDNKTNLIWKTCSEGLIPSVGEPISCVGIAIYYTWEDAKTICTKLNAGNGYANNKSWRLPSVEELSTLIDYGRENPAIDTTYFPNTRSSNYWSSSTYIGNAYSAWYVSNNTGVVDTSNKSDELYVRCVSDGQ